MKAAVIFSFMFYTGAFAILQNIVGTWAGARNLRSWQYPLFEIWRSASLLLFMGGVWWMIDEPLASWPAVRLTGFVIVGVGLFISMWSQLALGRNWVGGIAVHQQHQLVTHGPYKYVRHPLYSGMWISGVGLCFVSLNPLYGLAGLMWAFAYSVRIPFEEQVLEKKFRRRYTEYAAQTGAIIPGIGKGM